MPALSRLALSLVVVGLIGCANPSDAELIGERIGEAAMIGVDEGTRDRLVDVASDIAATRTLDALYSDRGCAPVNQQAAVRVDLPESTLFLVEHMVDCGEGGLPSVVTVFELLPGAPLTEVEWLTSYAVGLTADAASIESIDIVDGVPAQRVHPIGEASEEDFAWASKLDDAPEPATSTQVAAYTAEGVGTEQTCEYARLRSSWMVLADAHERCAAEVGSNAYSLRPAGHLQIREAELESGDCEVTTLIGYECYAEHAPRLAAEGPNAEDSTTAVATEVSFELPARGVSIFQGFDPSAQALAWSSAVPRRGDVQL